MLSFGRKFLSLLLALTIAFGALANVAWALPLEETDAPLLEGSYAAEKAARVKAENKLAVTPMDTTSGFISTSYIQCYIHENGGINIGTSDGDCLLYSYPGGNTSETMIRIDSQDYFFHEYVDSITFGDDGKSCVATALIDDVLVTQTMTIIRNPNSSTENVVSIKYTCENQSSVDKTIGVRIMLDTMLGDNDGAPFKVNGQSVTRELEFQGNAIPQYYQAMDSLTDPSLTATGYFYYSAAEKPDKVQFACWPHIRSASWNYQINADTDLTGDSAVVAYFNEKTVAPGGSTAAGTYYGAHQVNTAGSYESFPYTNDAYYDELALLCAQYSAYAYEDYKYLAPSGVFYNDKDNAKKDTETYNRSKVLNEALKADNFLDIVSANYANPTENSATYTLAHKKVNHNGQVRDLIVVVIRGTNKDEWQGNMNVTGTSYNEQSYHDSFQNGATQIESHLMRYMNTYPGMEDPMVLITGHSRGGGVGNLLAADLTADRVERIDENSIFAYLFAVPNVTTEYDTSMANIYNFCLNDDFVPNLPLHNEWGYGKHGTTFAITADDQTDTNFIVRQAISLDNSEGSHERESFDAAKTAATIEYIEKKWKTVDAYYNQAPNGGTAIASLYNFMHDVVGLAAMNDLGAMVQLKLYTGDESSCVYTKVANFFVDGMGMRHCVNDNHQMFTYYNALAEGLFPTVTTAEAAVYQETDETEESTADGGAAELEALKAFAAIGGNQTLLGWDPEDTDTWEGVTWNDDGRVIALDLCYLGLTGNLDLSAFSCLTEADVSGNALEGLLLPDPETSSLAWLDCSYNALTQLDISGQPLELLDCTYNNLDADAMEEAAAGIPYVSCTQQNNADIAYDADDCAALTEHVLTNDEIWDPADDPGSWIGVTWEEEDGTHYVTGLDLSGCGLSGELDVSGLAHLEVLSCSSNAITAIDASGCGELEFVNCNNNAITEINVSEEAQLTNVSCSDNYLTAEAVSGLNAENVSAGRQQIQGSLEDFSQEEYAVLAPVAETLGLDPEAPGEWLFVTWEKQEEIYHAAALDLSDQAELTGTLDLSGFAYLEQISCASSGIEAVILPRNMTALNGYAFYGCTALESVELPEALTEIGEYAFYGCAALESVEFPAGLLAVDDHAFDLCTGLTHLYFPASLETLGDGAFQNCYGLLAAYFTGDAPVCGEAPFMYASVGFTVYRLEETTGWDNAAWTVYITDLVQRLSIQRYPDKLLYQKGEAVDTTGLTLLLLGEDGSHEIITEGFTVEYEALDNPGTYTVTVTYGEYSVTYDVTVHVRSINDCSIYLAEGEYEYDYTGEEIRPRVCVEYEDVLLTEGVDYTVAYYDNIEPGWAQVEVVGINDFQDRCFLEFYIRITFTVTDWTELESDHDYADRSEITWIYTSPNTDIDYLALTFDENTSFEYDYDYLEFYNGDDEWITSYTGTDLAGQTVKVKGNTVKLVLTSDSSVTYWGFKVTDLREGYSFLVGRDDTTGKPTLTWDAVEDAAAYRVYRSDAADGTFSLIATVTDTAYTDTTAQAGKTWYYYVDTVDAYDDVIETSKIRSGVCTCAQPVVKAANVASSGKIKLTWSKVEGASKYQVYRATSKTGTYSLMKTTTSTSYTNTSAQAGTQYYYYVVAVDAADGKSMPSATVTRTCDLAQPVVTAANVASSGKIRLTWSKVDGAVEYKIYRSTTGKDGSWTLTKTTTGTSYTNTSAKAGTQYYYKVIAIASKSAANSAYSAVVSRTCDLAQPVVTLSNVASSGKIKVTWNAVDGAVNYKVYRSTTGKDGSWSLVKTTTATSYTNTSAKAGTTYYYKVIAVASKSAANSAYSAAKSRTCDLARPVVSIGRSTAGKPRLTWKAVDGAISYKIYRATSSGGTYTLMKTTTATSYTNTSAKAGTTYYYKVLAVHSKSAANSAYSLVKSIAAK